MRTIYASFANDKAYRWLWRAALQDAIFAFKNRYRKETQSYNAMLRKNTGLLMVQKSDKQKTLEKNGCVFVGQELLNNHEMDHRKPCYCNRPNKHTD